MGSILGLHGLSKADGTNKLIAAFGGDMINVATGLGYGLNLSKTSSVEFEVFLQSLFFQNFNDTPLSFNGTAWSRANCAKVPLSKYMKLWKGNLYLGYVNINGTTYSSRVWRSDPPRNDALTWGYEAGSNLSTLAGNPLVSSANAGFLTNNIKRGDPFFITSGGAAGEYRVLSVSADQQLTLTNIYPYPAPQVTSTNASYWTGGNWLDFDRDDGDFLTGLAENTYQLIAFKRDSLHRYDGVKPTKVRGAVGTTSPRSIASLHELTIYFYGGVGQRTGFYAYDGRESQKISAPIEDWIQGISGTMYTGVIGWQEGELYRAYVGNISNIDHNIVFNKCVFTWNYNTRAWSIDPIGDAIVAAAEFRQSGTKQIYIGTTDDEVMITPSGNDFDASPIGWSFATKPIYPTGTENVNTFTRIQIISENANSTTVKYKLHLNPFNTDQEYKGLGQLTGDKTELVLPEGWNQASGIELQFAGIGTQQPTPLIKKASIFYRKESSIIQ